MRAKRWFERAEYASLGFSALGTVAAAVSQQIIYAAAPLTLALFLNVIRQRSHYLQTQSLQQQIQLLASGQREEVQGVIAAAISQFLDEIKRQLATIQPYQYQLVLDPPDSRAVLMEALAKAQERLIIVSPWLRQPVFDELRSQIENALSRGVKVSIGFGYQGDIGKDKAIIEGNAGWVYQLNCDLQGNYSALPDWLKLRDTHKRLTLKLLKTHEKFLVCDRSLALIGSHNLLSAGTNGKQREIGLKTDDPRIIQDLIERFENAQDSRMRSDSHSAKASEMRQPV